MTILGCGYARYTLFQCLDKGKNELHNKINVHCVVQVHMLQLSSWEREGGHLESSGELRYCDLRRMVFYPGSGAIITHASNIRGSTVAGSIHVAMILYVDILSA